MQTDYTKVINERMQYVKSLDPAEARFHTFHFFGDLYFNYLSRWQKTFRENQWRDLIKNIPDKYIISEAEPSFGYVIDGRKFNMDTIRFQIMIKELWKCGILELLENSHEAPNILDIGGGWGQLVYHLKNIVPKAKFTIIELPIVNVLARKYLSYHLKERLSDITFYGDEEYQNAKFDALFDLVISANSFHEFTNSQAREYAEFIYGHLRPAGKFYCSSGDGSPFNPGGVNITELLSQYFEYMEIPVEGGHTAKGNFLPRLLDVSPRKILERIGIIKKQSPAFVSHHRLYRPKGTPR